jgi:hypothetical protein
MPTRTEILPFPCQDEIDANEDGVGFALRMATMNGLSFNDLARHLASRGHLYLPASAAVAVASMFGGSPTRVLSAFVERYFRGELHGARFLGHEFLRTYHLRQTRPQVCPACLGAGTHALAVWSIGMVTSCPEHGIRLLDQCVCGRPVSWRRPSLTFCECGRLLSVASQPCCQADRRELAISHQIMHLLGPEHCRCIPADRLMKTFDSVSVDTFVRLIWIFGIVGADANRASPRCISRVLPTPDSSGVCIRAYDRIAHLLDMQHHRTEIHETSLAMLQRECTLPADMRIVQTLRTQLDQSGFSTRASHRRTGEQQRPLSRRYHV